jgi:hypothetical protein
MNNTIGIVNCEHEMNIPAGFRESGGDIFALIFGSML